MNGLDSNRLQQMVFIYNALEQGWQVKRKKNSVYEFTKERKHEERDLKQITTLNGDDNEKGNEKSNSKWLEEYLKHFIEINSKMDILFANNNNNLS